MKEIGDATGYATATLYRLLRWAIARQQIPVDSLERGMANKNRVLNGPLPPLAKQNWNAPRISEPSDGANLPNNKVCSIRHRVPEKIARNQALIKYWEQCQNLTQTAKAFDLTTERVRQIVLRQAYRHRKQELDSLFSS